MNPFPNFIQHDAMDCGPTCLREKAHLSREGVSMPGISEAAENIGFRTVGAHLSFCVRYIGEL